jgi:hypothetical protein
MLFDLFGQEWLHAFSIGHFVIRFCQWHATGRWFSPATLVYSTNKTDRRDITEIVLKVALSILTFTVKQIMSASQKFFLEKIM